MRAHAAALLAGACLFAAAIAPVSIGPAHAEKVGVAAAVNPDAFSSLSQTPNQQLKIGKSIFYNERINTTASGLVQVLLVDGSTFTVGPNSNLVIDKFVYNPKKKTGELVATFSKGTIRFIGGKLSKNAGGVNVKTPDGALAIRGGMFQGNVNRKIYSFLYGDSLTFRGRNGQTQTVYQPGYTLDLSSGGASVRPTTSQDINSIMAALTSGGGNTNPGGAGGGTDPGGPGPGAQQQQQQATINGVDQLISTATTTQIQNEIIEQIKKLDDATTTPQQTNNDPPSQTVPLPDELKVRVLASPDVFYARDRVWRRKDPEENLFLNRPQLKGPPFPFLPIYGEGGELIRIGFPGSQGILGGDDEIIRCDDCPFEGKQVENDDFNVTADVANGRATGTIPELIAREDGDLERLPEAQFDLPIFNTPGVHQVTDGSYTEIIDGEPQVFTLTGSAFTARDGGFFAYQLFENHQGQPDFDEPLLAFGGANFRKPQGEPDQVRLFNLYSDPRQGIQIPFASALSAPDDTSQASVSPLYLLENSRTPIVPLEGNKLAQRGSDYGGEHPYPKAEPNVWVQASFLAQNDDNGTEGGDPTEQQSILVLALGTQDKETGALSGTRRGSARVQIPVSFKDVETNEQHDFTIDETVNLTGKIASQGNPDGAHLMGDTTPHLVIGADSTDSHVIFKDDPLHKEVFAKEFGLDNSDFFGATYHIGEQGDSADASTLEHDPGEFHGYAAGIFQQAVYEGNAYDDFDDIGMLGNESPDDVHISFQEGNRLFANFDLAADSLDNEADGGGAQLAFGDYWSHDQGHSAFISNSVFAATEASVPSFVTVDHGYDDYFEHYEYEGYQEVQAADASTYLVGSGLLNPGTTLCADCDFMRWGAWGGRLEYEDGEWLTKADVNMGWFVTGNVPTFADLPLRGTASYAGTTIGNVAAVIDPNTPTERIKSYIATGNVGMDWDFAQRAGNFRITDFDKNGPYGALNVRGVLRAPGQIDPKAKNHFGGPLAGTVGLNRAIGGAASGSFVRGGGTDVTRGIIGNWKVRNNIYGATGIYGAARRGAVNPNGRLPSVGPN